MGFQSIVHGRIMSEFNTYQKNKDFLSTLTTNQTFPWITTEMFHCPNLQLPYYYEPIITFGMTYKQVEEDWTSWIIRFEYILSNINFETAKVHLETELYGSYNFFWITKKYTNNNKEDLIENENWYFGTGQRDVWGRKENEQPLPIEIFDFNYPFIITSAHKAVFELLMQEILKIGLHKTIYLYDLPKSIQQQQNVLWPLLTKLSLDKQLEFFTDDVHKGPCIRMHEEINIL